MTPPAPLGPQDLVRLHHPLPLVEEAGTMGIQDRIRNAVMPADHPGPRGSRG